MKMLFVGNGSKSELIVEKWSAGVDVGLVPDWLVLCRNFLNKGTFSRVYLLRKLPIDSIRNYLRNISTLSSFPVFRLSVKQRNASLAFSQLRTFLSIQHSTQGTMVDRPVGHDRSWYHLSWFVSIDHKSTTQNWPSEITISKSSSSEVQRPANQVQPFSISSRYSNDS